MPDIMCLQGMCDFVFTNFPNLDKALDELPQLYNISIVHNSDAMKQSNLIYFQDLNMSLFTRKSVNYAFKKCHCNRHLGILPL